MSVAWDQTNQRYRLVHHVLEEFATEGRPSMASYAAIDAVFGDFDSFLLEVQRRWHRSLVGRLDLVLEQSPTDLTTAVSRLWRELCQDLASTRLLLDAHAGKPVLAAGDERLRQAVLDATGVDLVRLPAERQCVGRTAMRWWRRAVAFSGSPA